MIRGSLFRNPALKITLKKEINISKTFRCVAIMCRPPRKKVEVRHGNVDFLKVSKEPFKVNYRFYSDYPNHIKVLLPALSPTMESGTIISWEKKEGDKLNEGDLLAEIETDKATMGFETPEEGYLAKILIPAGTKNVQIGKLVCIIVENEGDVDAFKDFVDTGASETPPLTPSPSPSPSLDGDKPSIKTPLSPLPALQPAVNAEGKILASPLAKRIANEQGISLKSIGKGSGIYGSIKSQDIKKISPAVIHEESSPVQNAFEDIPVSQMRSVIAKRLVESKQTIPHYYLSVDINVSNILASRQKINKLNEKEGIKLSVNDFIIKAVAVACKKVPEANSSWKENFIRQYESVDVSVAVSTDKGLITPIVFNAHTKGLAEISADVKTLAEKARQGKLQPHEFQGGTISVSNLGMFGINNFSAIINPPQACILSVGSTEKRVVPDPKSEQGFKVVDILSVTLSCDHRVIDGAVGATWLTAFRNYMENPDLMLL